MGDNCSDEYPTTDVFYAELSWDVVTIVFLTISCILAIITIAVFLEELKFLQEIFFKNEVKTRKMATILGLFPVTCVMAVIALLVPSSTVLVDLITSCYLSVCIYTFVSLMIDYHGGDDQMITTLADEKVAISVPPCCCCCCCILKPITLTQRALKYLKLCAIQVAVIRPIVLFIGSVLWTDGKFEPGFSATSGYTYISVISAVSTLVSMYGLVVIYRASRYRLSHVRLRGKFISLQLAILLLNLQNSIFNILGDNGIPECVQTRGSRVRASAMHHALLVLESFLLAVLARFAYRRDEPEQETCLKESGNQGITNYAAVCDTSINGDPAKTVTEMDG